MFKKGLTTVLFFIGLLTYAQNIQAFETSEKESQIKTPILRSQVVGHATFWSGLGFVMFGGIQCGLYADLCLETPKAVIGAPLITGSLLLTTSAITVIISQQQRQRSKEKEFENIKEVGYFNSIRISVAITVIVIGGFITIIAVTNK